MLQPFNAALISFRKNPINGKIHQTWCISPIDGAKMEICIRDGEYAYPQSITFTIVLPEGEEENYDPVKKDE